MGCVISKPTKNTRNGIKLAEHAVPVMDEDVSARARRVEFNKRVSFAQERMGSYGIVMGGEGAPRLLSPITYS